MRALREDGLTVVEVMIAAMILIVSGIAMLNLVDTASRGAFRAEQSQVVSNRLQQEMEKIKQLPFEQVALDAIPADTSDTNDPRWRRSGGNYATNRDGSELRPLIYNGTTLFEGGTVEGGAVSATPEHFEDSGDVQGTIYRFVVWEDDPSCGAACPGTQDLKRVIVAVRLDVTASGGQRLYQELQAQIVDPEVQPVDNENPIPPDPNQDKPWTFWLTDTPCSIGTRQPIAADHLTHNTRGVCSTGPTNGNNPGAPDLLYDRATTLNPENPIFDYATDVEPPVNPETDKGLQLVKGSTSGCPSYALEVASEPDPEETRFHEVHKWLSPPIPEGYDIALSGKATLSLWTQTVNQTVHAGQICVWLFIRQTTDGVESDVAATNQVGGANHFLYSESTWPDPWTEIELQLDFDLAEHLTPGRRLGLAIAVERDGTGGGGLQFMYDEPSFDSRLEVKTPSQVPTF